MTLTGRRLHLKRLENCLQELMTNIVNNIHKGQTFMVIGAAGELPKPPAEKIVFLEDMTDSELADAVRAFTVAQIDIVDSYPGCADVVAKNAGWSFKVSFTL